MSLCRLIAGDENPLEKNAAGFRIRQSHRLAGTCDLTAWARPHKRRNDAGACDAMQSAVKQWPLRAECRCYKPPGSRSTSCCRRRRRVAPPHVASVFQPAQRENAPRSSDDILNGTPAEVMLWKRLIVVAVWLMFLASSHDQRTHLRRNLGCGVVSWRLRHQDTGIIASGPLRDRVIDSTTSRVCHGTCLPTGPAVNQGGIRENNGSRNSLRTAIATKSRNFPRRYGRPGPDLRAADSPCRNSACCVQVMETPPARNERSGILNEDRGSGEGSGIQNGASAECTAALRARFRKSAHSAEPSLGMCSRFTPRGKNGSLPRYQSSQNWAVCV